MTIEHLIIVSASNIEYQIGDNIESINNIPLKSLSWKSLLQSLNYKNHPFTMKRHPKGINNESETLLVWDPLELQMTSYSRSKTIEILNRIPKTLNKISETNIPNTFSELSKYIGYYGYLGFELARYLEDYTSRPDFSQLPDIYLMLPKRYFIERRGVKIYIELSGDPIYLEPENIQSQELINFEFNMDISSYLKSVGQILEHIKDGEIYQTNFTHQFLLKTDKHPVESYLDLIDLSKTNHHAFILTRSFSILSISPELFLHSFDGLVTTKPIKGTIKRGQDKESDEKNKLILMNSEKDRAELAMIVDLLRNDLGRSANPGSVNVKGHAKLETYSNVHHLVSTITSEIPKKPEHSWKLLLRAFPGGSISGVPKIKALEILEKYETTPRGVYTGSIGCITISGDMEFNIAIRTITQINNTVKINAGGGIVIDSEPWLEFVETIHKAKHLCLYYGYDLMQEIVSLNGIVLSRSEIKDLDLENKTSGFFESILVENTQIHRFQRHWSRMMKGFTHYKIDKILFQDRMISISEFNHVLMQHLNQFVLLNLHPITRMRVKVVVEQSSVNVLVEMFPYELQGESIELLFDQSEFIPPEEIFHQFKPINYGSYRERTKVATDNGYWDILLHDGEKILETGKSSLVFQIKNKWFTTGGAILKGTIRGLLIEKGITERNLMISDLPKCDYIGVINAMIKVRPVTKIFSNDEPIWESKLDYEGEIAKIISLIE